MICPSCGNELEEGLNFCPHCGEKIDPVEAMLKEATPGKSAPVQPEPSPAPAGTVPDTVAKDRTSGNAKRIGIAVGIIAAVIIALFAGRAILNKMHEKAYAEAKSELKAQKYEEALEDFNKLGDYEDSKSQAALCQRWIDYQSATELMDKGSFEEAQTAFTELKDFEDSEAQATHCANMLQYEEAEKLFEEKKYEAAREIYNKLPYTTEEGMTNASEHLVYCNNILKYNEGIKLLKDKKYYSAYTKLNSLGSFKDAKDKADSCKQTFPGTGETYRNKKYATQAVSLKIVPPSNGTYNYLKFYSGKELVSCVAIGKNSTATVVLPVGSYTIKNAYGSGPWFGDKDMFGDNATYIKLMNGSSDRFSLEANMIYTLTLRSSTATGGNSVGSRSENRSDF